MRMLSSSFILATAVVLTGCGSVASTAILPKSSAVVSAQDSQPNSQKLHMYSTVDVMGIGPAYQTMLKGHDIQTVNDLLEAGRTRAGRAHLAKHTGISSKLILTWVNHADLMRVTGAGPVYARMLEDAGIDSVAELAGRNADNLRSAIELVRTKGGKTMVDRMPSAETLSVWVMQARDLGRYVEY